MTTAELTSEVISDMNREREAEAKRQIRHLLNGIIAQQQAIRIAETTIADHKVQLAAIKIIPVVAADLVV